VEVERRLAEYGPNTITAERRTSAFRILLRQFANLLIAILLVATVISGLFGEVIDAIVILAIVLFAVLLGFFQEYRAEKSLESLKKMLSPTCTVLREGARREVPAQEIVPGDIMLLEAGDRLVADARVLEAFNLQVDEAQLTGESAPVMKTTGPLEESTLVADRVNMAFAGTTVVQGRGTAVVASTGMRTEFGRIASEVAVIKAEKTPLEERMEEIGSKLSRIALVLVSIIAVGGLIEEYSAFGTIGLGFLIRIFLFAVALAVASVPEALPAIVTGTLAIGMRIMAKRNALVRSMPAVETLGSTQVICSDKTGTLTKGQLTVRRAIIAGTSYEVSGTGYDPKGEIYPTNGGPRDDKHKTVEIFARAAVLCSDANLIQESGRWIVQGDTTEGALVVFAEKAGISQSQVRNSYPRIGEIPFSSERKRLTTVHKQPDGRIYAYMKGAPETVLSYCSDLYVGEAVKALSGEDRMAVLKFNEGLASEGLRVLAVAEKQLSSPPDEYSEKIETGFTFLGLAGMIDPPRPEAIEAVAVAKAVGMTTVMITGDHKLTALAVAKETGIYNETKLALTGDELEKISDAEFEEKVDRVSVYARVSPSHKLKIVDGWQKKAKVVAMTGDGVNDAPALKKADIGIAMGITGTDVAKEAADLILSDDNFATIIRAIELGRWIYENIKKYLAYLLQANFVEIAVITLATLLVLPLEGMHGSETLPLLAVQILYINLATDGLPAIALGFSPPDPDLMRKPPRPKHESVFTKEVIRLILFSLLVQTPVLLLGFVTGLSEGLSFARSRLFLMFIGVELAMALNCRSLTHSAFRLRPHKWLLLSVIWETFLISGLVLIAQTRDALGVMYPTFADFLWVMAASVETFLSIELLKYLYERRRAPAQI